MRISACYIVKDEEKNLAQSIGSLRDAVDEIIVADTGSEDNTIVVARQLGAAVYSFPWQEDFAAARNFALSRATGDWLILLDADEYFTESTAGNIRSLLAGAAQEVNGLLIQMVNYDTDRQVEQDRFYQLRIVRNLPGLAYEGIVHERLRLRGDDIPGIALVKSHLLEIYHTGYRTESSEAKSRRNLRLLQKALAAGSSEAELSLYLCVTYAALKEWGKALHYGWLNVHQGRSSVTYAAQCHRILLEYYADKDNWEARERRLELAELAASQFPELPDFHAEYGECLFQWRRYDEAAGELRQALALWDGYDGLEPCLLTQEHIDVMEKRRELFAARAAAQAKLRITACIICKNEAGNMPKWLDNACVYADEIVAVDTGSTDGTVNILADRGVSYYEYQWQEDFGAARNFAMEKATGDVIVFLDADETLRYPASIRGSLSRFWENRDDWDVVVVDLHNIDADNNNNLINTNQVVRILKNRAGLCYAGAVHEQVADSRCPGRQLRCTYGDELLAVAHTGYSSGIIRQKLARNLSLLTKVINEGADMELYYGNLAGCYFGMGEYSRALDYALLAIQSGYQPVHNCGDNYWIALESMEELGYGYDDRLAVAEVARQELSEVPDFWGYKGYYLARQGHWASGRDNLAKAFDLHQSGSNGHAATHFPQLYCQFRTYMAECYFHLGEWQLAEAMYLEVLRLNRWYEAAISGYLDMGADRAALYELYASAEERKALERLLDRHGFGAGSQPEDWDVRKAMTALVENMQYLFVSLLGRQPDFASAMFKEQIGLLPEGLQRLVLAYHGRLEDAGQLEQSDYQSMMSAVTDWGTAEIIEAYRDLGKVFGEAGV